MMPTEDTSERKPKGFIRFRYLVILVCMAGMSDVYSLKVSYNIITGPWYKKRSDSNSSSHSPSNIQTYEKFIKPAYYLGFGLAAIPGARLAELYSAKWASGIAAVTYGTIFALNYQVYSLDSVPLVMFSRLMEGISVTVFGTATAVLTARWSPPSERYILCSITHCGQYLGSAIGLFAAFSIYITPDSAQILFLLGGFVTILWLIFHIIYIEDHPHMRNRMSVEERNFIVSSLEDQLYDPAVKRKSRVPWRHIFKSGPFLSLLGVHCAIRLIYRVNLNRTIEGYKTFRWKKDMNRFNRAIVKCSSYFWSAVMTVTLGLVFNTLQHQRAISKGGAVKIATIAGLLMPVTLLFVDYFGGADWELAAKPLLNILLAGVSNTVQINHIELAPNYAGTLLGITSSIRTVSSFVFLAFSEVNFNNTITLIVYGIIAVLSLAAMLIYYFFHSTEVQPWNQSLES